ncbi:hypothetical protein BYT27DRAFT_7200455 [Phlegmacium glaucopus]|nr:hypothetical protein BYT27DRAFT_7200455 [Phlegmacium glaucopus]
MAGLLSTAFYSLAVFFQAKLFITIMHQFVISPSSPQLNGLIEALEMMPYQPKPY